MKKQIELDHPDINQPEAEVDIVSYNSRFKKVLFNTVYVLVIVAAFSIIVSTVFLPVLKIYGSSMNPTVNEGDIVVALKGSNFDQGDVIGLWYGNKLLVKRVIAGPGQWVDIDQDGNVYVDDKLLDEPYISEKAVGDCDINLPCQIPEDRYFVMGDHRLTSHDSRNTVVGNIAEEQIVGRIVFRIWPFSRLGTIQ